MQTELINQLSERSPIYFYCFSNNWNKAEAPTTQQYWSIKLKPPTKYFKYFFIKLQTKFVQSSIQICKTKNTAAKAHFIDFMDSHVIPTFYFIVLTIFMYSLSFPSSAGFYFVNNFKCLFCFRVKNENGKKAPSKVCKCKLLC